MKNKFLVTQRLFFRRLECAVSGGVGLVVAATPFLTRFEFEQLLRVGYGFKTAHSVVHRVSKDKFIVR